MTKRVKNSNVTQKHNGHTSIPWGSCLSRGTNISNRIFSIYFYVFFFFNSNVRTLRADGTQSKVYNIKSRKPKNKSWKSILYRNNEKKMNTIVSGFVIELYTCLQLSKKMCASKNIDKGLTREYGCSIAFHICPEKMWNQKQTNSPNTYPREWGIVQINAIPRMYRRIYIYFFFFFCNFTACTQFFSPTPFRSYNSLWRSILFSTASDVPTNIFPVSG